MAKFQSMMYSHKPIIVCPPELASNMYTTLLLEPCIASSYPKRKDIETPKNYTTVNDVVVISDDEDDMVLASSAEETENVMHDVTHLRKNPVELTNKNNQNVSKELICEENLTFLSTDEAKENDNNNSDKQVPSEVPTLLVTESQEKVPVKKTRPPVKRKSRKKLGFTRRKQRRTPSVKQEREGLGDLQDLVETTTNLLVEYLETSRQRNYVSETCSSSNKMTILRTQIGLLSLVTNTDHNELYKKFTKSNEL